jgi:deazaflavin-dependent oxidoreductase (nitroreductase family)
VTAVPVDASKSHMPVWLPAFNRRVTNRVQGIYAPYIPPLAVVIHVGRRSGKVYTTPVAARLYDSKVAIALPYSADTQWVKNLTAAGSGEMIRRGRRFAFTNPRILTAPGQETLPPLIARLARRMPVLVADLA